MAETQKVRDENLRLEALRITNALFGGKGAQANRFLAFAGEVFEFIKGGPEAADEEE